MPSQSTLANLPDIAALQSLLQSLAMLDAVLCAEWEYRYYSFDSKWGAGETLATKRNGAGDECFMFFNQHGAIIKGFDHESKMNLCDEPEEVWKNVLDEAPKEGGRVLG